MNRIKNLWWMIVAGIFGIYTSAFAGDVSSAPAGSGPITLPNPLTNCSGGTFMSCVVTPVTNFLLVLAVPICAIMVLWGGFTIMTSEGDPEKFTTGRNTIFYAAVGFVIVLLANSVATVINSVFQ